MKLFITQGYYGSQNTPCNVLCATMPNGSTWYCVKESQNVNCTFDEIQPGVDIETLTDIDYFYHSSPIETLDELKAAIES